MINKYLVVFRHIFVLVGLLMLLVGCAQTPKTVQEHHLRQKKSQPSSEFKSDDQIKKEDIVIYVYPKKGPISQGQYFSLPTNQ